MSEVVEIIKNKIHGLAITVINEGADTLDISIYDDDGRDLSEDKEWLNDFLSRLYDYIHGEAGIPERDLWAMEAGRAQILLELSDTFGIKIGKQEGKILKWLSNLF